MPISIDTPGTIPEETGAAIPTFAASCHYCLTVYDFDKRDGEVTEPGFIEVRCPTCDHVNKVAT
jgi:hypothetical protein